MTITDLKLKSYQIVLLVFLSGCAISALTLPKYGITWDEPEGFFDGVVKISQWLDDFSGRIVQHDFQSAFSKQFTRHYWPPPTPATQEVTFYNNHPPVPRICGYCMWRLCGKYFGDVISMRLASCIAYGLMLAIIFIWVKEVSIAIGLFAVFFAVTIPRLFAFSHFLTTEMFLACFWIMVSYSFWRAIKLQSPAWLLAGWLLFGLAVNVKFTSLIIPVPIFIFLAMKNRRQIKGWIVWMPACVPIIYLMNPTWWHDPFVTFFKNHIQLSLSRTSYLNISTFYFGEITDHAPWHYPLVMTVFTLPAIMLFFSICSLKFLVGKNSFSDILLYWWLNIALLLLIVCFPLAPRYDGVRLFLPIFPFLAMAASIPAHRLVRKIRSMIRRKRFCALITALLVACLVTHQVMQVWLYRPYQLSYYNELAGGISGANRLGMEPTYWLEAVTPEFIQKINQLMASGSTLSIYPYGIPILQYYQKSNMLRQDIKIQKSIKAEHIILVNRKSTRSVDAYKWFSKNNYICKNSVNLFGVPLVWFFCLDDDADKFNE
jgi:4-amino-4-deoxy-L-arabinose transferase-like glycosyltransferase